MPIRLSVGLPISLYVCLLSVTEVMSVSYLVYFLASQSVGQSVALSFYHRKGGGKGGTIVDDNDDDDDNNVDDDDENAGYPS